jgi:arabinofuranosyltransferase
MFSQIMPRTWFYISMTAATVMLLITAWMSDDAFITLRVIDNFVNGFGLRYNVIERVQVFTHPLWLFFLTPFYALTREPLVTNMAISVLLSLASLWILATKVASSIKWGCVIVLIAMITRSISEFSTSGLETPLTFVLIALMCWQINRVMGKSMADAKKAHEPDDRSKGIWIVAGLAGLLVLNRLDLSLLVAPLILYLIFVTKSRDRPWVLLLACSPSVLWMAFSVLYYGSPFPNTAYAKIGTGYSTEEMLSHGIEYLEDLLIHDPILALAICLALVGGQNWCERSLGAGIALYIAYILWVGGDFMSGRFFAAPGFLALCMLATMSVENTSARRLLPWFFVALLFILCSLIPIRLNIPKPYHILENGTAVFDFDKPLGIDDERSFYYADTGLLPVLENIVKTGSEVSHPMARMGLTYKLKLSSENRSIVMYNVSFAGMPAYYAGPYLHFLDRIGLTDPFLARFPAIKGGRIGHFLRNAPPGYKETILEQKPSLTGWYLLDPLLNDVILATRAPLFAEGRWQAIWRLSSGYYSGRFYWAHK